MANSMTGRILVIGPTQTIVSKKTGQNFYKREIVLDCTRFDPYTGERGYENTPVFEFSGDRCSLLDQFQPGQVVTISFDIQGTKATERYFNSVRGYKIELKSSTQAPQQGPTAQPPYQTQGYQQPQGYQNAPQQGFGGYPQYPPKQADGFNNEPPF